MRGHVFRYVKFCRVKCFGVAEIRFILFVGFGGGVLFLFEFGDFLEEHLSLFGVFLSLGFEQEFL